MPITFRCPYCQQELTAPDEAAGQAGKCRFCNATVQAPTVSDAPAQLIQPGGAPPPTPPPSGEGYNGYAAAPQPGYGGGNAEPSQSFQATGVIDAGAIVGEAWAVTTNNIGVFVAGTLITIFLFYGSIIMAMLLLMPRGMMTTYDPYATPPPALTVAYVAITLALFPLPMGLFSMAIEILTRGSTGIATLFTPYRRYGRLLATYIVIVLPYLLITVLLAVLSNTGLTSVGARSGMYWIIILIGLVIQIYLWLGLGWAMIEVLDRDAPPLDAIRASWEASAGKRWMLLLTEILLSLIYMAGALLCGVGVLLTLPVFIVGNVIIYRQLRGLQGNI